MTEQERERLKQIREQRRLLGFVGVDQDELYKYYFDHVDFLLSLLDGQAVVRIMDDLPYRIIEEMGLGLTFRSCACGQLPCARLRPLRDALEATATRMRDACVEAVKTKCGHIPFDELIVLLESLTLDQVEQENQ